LVVDLIIFCRSQLNFLGNSSGELKGGAAIAGSLLVNAALK
jgi:predicted outer membrane repeat protein